MLSKIYIFVGRIFERGLNRKGVSLILTEELQQLRASQSVPVWTPVSEGLPKTLDEVFFVRKGDVQRGVYSLYPEPHFRNPHGDRYWHPREQVTHWMPSPTPAKP